MYVARIPIATVNEALDVLVESPTVFGFSLYINSVTTGLFLSPQNKMYQLSTTYIYMKFLIKNASDGHPSYLRLQDVHLWQFKMVPDRCICGGLIQLPKHVLASAVHSNCHS